MNNRHAPEPEETKTASCPVGGCGASKGMCPGLALGIALLIGLGVQTLTGLEWAGPGSGILVALLLILGIYPGGGRWPNRKSLSS